jgi:hypothetical protein
MDHSSHIALFYFIQYTAHLATTTGKQRADNIADPSQFYLYSWHYYEQHAN